MQHVRGEHPGCCTCSSTSPVSGARRGLRASGSVVGLRRLPACSGGWNGRSAAYGARHAGPASSGKPRRHAVPAGAGEPGLWRAGARSTSQRLSWWSLRPTAGAPASAGQPARRVLARWGGSHSGFSMGPTVRSRSAGTPPGSSRGPDGLCTSRRPLSDRLRPARGDSIPRHGRWNGGRWNGGRWNGGRWNGGRWNGGTSADGGAPADDVWRSAGWHGATRSGHVGDAAGDAAGDGCPAAHHGASDDVPRRPLRARGCSCRCGADPCRVSCHLSQRAEWELLAGPQRSNAARARGSGVGRGHRAP